MATPVKQFYLMRVRMEAKNREVKEQQEVQKNQNFLSEDFEMFELQKTQQPALLQIDQ